MVKNRKLLTVLAALEIILMVSAVAFDLFLPTVLLIASGLAFLLLRREEFSDLGFRKADKPFKMIAAVFGLSVVWTAVDFCLILPILNHLTGTTQDLSGFEKLKGDVPNLLFYLASAWILAALGEELAYRGFLQNRISSLFQNKKVGLVVSVILASILFGFAHTEQGVIGIIVTGIDAIIFNVVRYRFKNLWAGVLMHGFMNSIGMIVFFFTGPIYGLW